MLIPVLPIIPYGSGVNRLLQEVMRNEWNVGAGANPVLHIAKREA